MNHLNLTNEEMVAHKASVRVGKEFAQAYKDGETKLSNELLEKFIELRRSLPRYADGTHVGCGESYPATQGEFNL